MKLKNDGMTLIELVTVTVIVSTIALWGGSVLTGALNPAGSVGELRLAEVGATGQNLTREISNYFSRARTVTTTPFGVVGAGYLLQNQGGITLQSDMRQCGGTTNNFYPPNSAANFSQIVITCCQPGIVVNGVPSACPANTWGVTIQIRDAGGAVTRTCHPNIVSMSTIPLGTQSNFGGQNMLQLDFAGETQFDRANQPTGLKRVYFSRTVVPGNTIGSPLFTCSRQGQFN